MRKSLFLLMLSALCGAGVRAQTTLTATSCASTAVQFVLNSVVADLTTVVIPAGTCTWTSQVIYNQVYSTVIQGGGSTSGTTSDGLNNPLNYNDVTTILDDFAHTGSPNQTLALNLAYGKTFRMTGMTWGSSSSQTNPPFNGIIGVSGNSHSVRFDHNHFVPTLAARCLNFNGWLYGVTDHNVFENNSGTNSNFIEINGAGWNGVATDIYGDASWTDLSYFGSQKFMFAENNTFKTPGPAPTVFATAYDVQEGGRFVFRYNSLINTQMQQHGIGHDGPTPIRDRSPRALEFYSNVASFAYTPGNAESQMIEMEGGAILTWNNTSTGFKNLLFGYVVRTTNNPYTQNAPPNGWGYCGNGQTGATSVWDENLTTLGYPCIDQLGRGKGDLITGVNWPNILDNVTGTQTWPHQAIEPIYSWGQTFNPPTMETDFYWSEKDSVTVENRDIYLELPNHNEAATFNGTAGIGCGPAAGVGCVNPVAQPATCTAGVGYWKPVNQTLYICAAGSVWNAYYTPYTWPHPLASATATWGNMDIWMPMNSGSSGTQLTSTLLSSGSIPNTTTVGTTTSWTTSPNPPPAMALAASQCGQMGSVVVNNVNYPVGTAEQAISYNTATNENYATSGTVPGGSFAVVNGCLIPGWANGGTITGQNGDLVILEDNGSGGAAAVVMQINNGNGGCGTTNYCLRIEVNPGSTRSTGIQLTSGHKYTFSLLANESTTQAFNGLTGYAELTVFDAQNNFAIVGQVSTAQETGHQITGWRFGNAEVTISTGTTYFETLMFDGSNVIYPNFPQGTPPAGSVTFSPSTIAFGTVPQGTTSSGMMSTLANTTGSTITYTGESITGTNAGDFTLASTTCGSFSGGTLGNGGTCTLNLTFKPTATVGTVESATLTLNFTGATGSPITIGLSGTSGGNAGVTITPATILVFGNQIPNSTSPSQNITVTSTGTGNLILGATNAVTLTGTNAANFTITSTTCTNGLSMAPAAFCTITMTFTPTSAGLFSAQINLSDNAAGSPQIELLAGTGGSVAPSPILTKVLTTEKEDSSEVDNWSTRGR